MRKPIKITLNHAALRPLRHACYGRLELDLEHASQTLETAAPQRTRHTMAACAYVERTAGLLHRIGWTDRR